MTVDPLAQEVVTHRICSPLLEKRLRIDDVPGGLRELPPVLRDVPLDEDAGGNGEACGLQDRRPVQTMEPNDVLAHEVEPLASFLPEGNVSSRLVRQSERGDVVGEGVHPDVENVVGLFGDRNAPLHARPAHAEVAQPLVDHREDLVAPSRRLDQEAIRLDLCPQPVRVGRQTEEEILLLGPLARQLVVGTDVPGLAGARPRP